MFNTCAKRAGAWSCLKYKVVHTKGLIKCTSRLTWFSSSRNEEKSKREKKKGWSTCPKRLSPIYTKPLCCLFSLSFYVCATYDIVEILLNSFCICPTAIDLKEFHAACLLPVLFSSKLFNLRTHTYIHLHTNIHTHTHTHIHT